MRRAYESEEIIGGDGSRIASANLDVQHYHQGAREGVVDRRGIRRGEGYDQQGMFSGRGGEDAMVGQSAVAVDASAGPRPVGYVSHSCFVDRPRFCSHAVYTTIPEGVTFCQISSGT